MPTLHETLVKLAQLIEVHVGLGIRLSTGTGSVMSTGTGYVRHFEVSLVDSRSRNSLSMSVYQS